MSPLRRVSAIRIDPHRISSLAAEARRILSTSFAASYIAAYKAGLLASGKVVANEVSIYTKKTATGGDYKAINPKVRCKRLFLALCICGLVGARCPIP